MESKGIEIIPSVLGWAMPSGLVTSDAIDTILNDILNCLDKNNVDGVLLALHGAMVSENNDDGEGYILETVRNKIGPDVPLVVTLDLHAVLTPLIASTTVAVPLVQSPAANTPST